MKTTINVFHSLLLIISQTIRSINSAGMLNWFQIRDLTFPSDTIFKLDVFISIPVEFVNDATSSIEINYSFQFKLKNATTTTDSKPSSIPYLVAPMEFDQTTFPNPGNQSVAPFTYEAYFGDDGFSWSYLEHPSPEPVNRRSSRASSRKKKKKTSKQMSMLFKQQVAEHLKRHRRSLSSHSAIHRSDIFTVISQTLDNYGLDGRICIQRAVCEMAQMELLVESPLHEILNHLCRVSSIHDEYDLLTPYRDAERFGSESRITGMMDACGKRYWQCPFSIFERNTT